MKKFLLALTAFLAFAASAAEVRMEGYPYCKTAELPAGRPAIFLIPIDGEIYHHTEPGHPDLRIVSSEGKHKSLLRRKRQKARSLFPKL